MSAVAVGVAATATTTATSLEPRTVPVPEQLAALLPLGGLRRGSVVAVQGSTSLLLALLSTASAAGSWTAVIGRPDLGLLAAAEAGIAVERLALVPRPGVHLAAVTAALLDGVDLVAVAGVERLSTAEARRLTGRVRHRGAVLLPLGDWPGADVRMHGERIEWDGLGSGHGRLRSMRLTVQVAGRGAAARPRTADLVLVGASAGATTAVPGVVPEAVRPKAVPGAPPATRALRIAG
jgi:hypothetical protein